MSLRDYARKRRFDQTPEPSGERAGSVGHRPIFVVQLHHASSRHYDFRLEADGVLKSWAVPKGPSLRPGEKRLAVEVEDHPLDYATFAGDIPKGHYGAGHVDVFDHGHWACDGDPLEAIAAGKVDFTLSGDILTGAWKLIRTRGHGRQMQWLLMKRDDDGAADAEADDFVAGGKQPTSRREVAKSKQPSTASTRRKVAAGDDAPRAASKVVATKSHITMPSAAKSTATQSKASQSRAPAPKAATSSAKAAPATRSRASDATWHRRALALDHARDGAMPIEFAPALATLRPHVPADDAWLHEIKWDGYRLLVDLVEGRARLRSRGGLDWNATFPEVARAVEALPVRDACIDGELVVLDADGLSDFTALQRVIDGTSKAQLRYLVFDLPGLAGVDLRGAALGDRKDLLKSLLGERAGLLAFSDHVVGHGAEVFRQTREKGIEGIVSKRIDGAYRAGRRGDWIKVKHEQTDEFVVVGYTAPKGARDAFGSLLMATRDGGALRYVGRVGTGFDAAALERIHARLRKIEAKTAAVELPDHVPFSARSVHWVEPQVVAEVAFRGWAKEGLLRQASFKRLRDDKTVEDVMVKVSKAKTKTPPDTDEPRPSSAVRQTGGTAAAASKPSTASATKSDARAAAKKRVATRSGHDRITHPDRVVFADAAYTKGDVAAYYRGVAKWLLPELVDRPLSVLRCPDGSQSPCFFQKHWADSLGSAVRSVALNQKSGRERYLYVDDIEGVVDLVQMGTIELHPWGARIAAPERPDRLVFDLDPGDGVGWPAIVAAARDVRARLRETGLQSFVRLSGGKGLHVVVPVDPGPSWDAVRGFCEAFAQALSQHAPDRYVATMSKAKRPGRIFIDWLRNARGSTSIASWSLRARAGAPVAVPLRWEDLGRIERPDAFDLDAARRRAVKLRKDPWDGFASLRQALPAFED